MHLQGITVSLTATGSALGHPGSLPFTGLDIWPLLSAAAVLVGAGLLLLGTGSRLCRG